MCNCQTTTLQTIPNPDFNAYPGDSVDPQGRKEYIEDWVTEPATTVDLDTHRYQCVECKEIGYYSGYGRSLFESNAKGDSR